MKRRTGLWSMSCAVSLALAGAAVIAPVFSGRALAADTRVSISAPTGPIEPGEQVAVNILVVPGMDIAGIQFDLRFDPACFAVDGVTPGGFLSQGGAATFFNTGKIDNQNGMISGAFGSITAPGQAVSGEGIFATVLLTAKAASQSCRVALGGVIAGDPEGNPVPVLVTNGNPLAPGAATFSWWVLSAILGSAVVLIAATSAGLLYRRHILLKAEA